VEKKGLAILLDALGRLPPDLTWTLDVVGDGPLADTLKRQAAAFGSRVMFHGQIAPEALAERYAESEIVVVPSVPATTGDQDGLPVVLLEALVAGRAIVASRLPGLDEAIIHGEHGLLVEPGDPEALASAIFALLESSELRHRLARSARSRGDLYSVESIGGRYLALLHDVAGAATSRRP
jgi:colanic acid/amylovoran biosynthesis glycosyltransferase